MAGIRGNRETLCTEEEQSVLAGFIYQRCLDRVEKHYHDVITFAGTT